MQLKTAIGAFFVEFSKFETSFVGMALRSLSKDPVFVEQTEKLLDLEGRLTLLDRMAHVRGISPTVMGELDALLLRARKLREQRDELARNLATIDSGNLAPHLAAVPRRLKVSRSRRADLAQLAEVEQLWMPSITQVQQFATEAIELQEMMRTVVEKMDHEGAPDDPVI